MGIGNTGVTIAALVAGCSVMAWAQQRVTAPHGPQPAARRTLVVQLPHKPKVPITAVSMGSLDSQIAIDINRSMKARRALAWDIVQKVWTPAGAPGSELPVWMTWYEQEDLEPLFRAMLTRAGRPTTMAQTTARVAAVMADHADKDLQRSLSSARLGKTLRQFTFPEFIALNLHAKPGTGNIFYSPSYVKHLLANAERIAAYNPAGFRHKVSTMRAPQRELEPDKGLLPANAYALSMDSEMPPDALMIKVDWAPVEQGAFPYFTDGKNLAKGFLESQTGNFIIGKTPNSDLPFIYHIATPQDRSGAARMIVVSDEKGKQWALMAMHIASKVRRTWLWITLMWLPPRAPYWQADRPAFFTQYEDDQEPWLTWPLHQYGMAVASDFREGDPTPWAAFDRVPEASQIGPNADLHDLSVSLKDLAGAMKGLQWSANPFIEAGMSHTNCIGCHQGSPNEFLATTLTKVRNTNVGDFSFSIATNRQMFARVLRERRPTAAVNGRGGASRQH